MNATASLRSRLTLPVIGLPLFIISTSVLIDDVPTVAECVARLAAEYEEAKRALAAVANF